MGEITHVLTCNDCKLVLAVGKVEEGVRTTHIQESHDPKWWSAFFEGEIDLATAAPWVRAGISALMDLGNVE